MLSEIDFSEGVPERFILCHGTAAQCFDKAEGEMTILELKVDLPTRLASEALSQQIRDAAKRRAAQSLLGVSPEARSGGGKLSLQAIQAEVNAVRQARRHAKDVSHE